MKKLLPYLLIIIAVLIVQRPVNAQIVIDGVFFDWPDSTQLDKAPNLEETTFAEGDDTDPVRGSADPIYFSDLDIQDVYATDDDSLIYLRIKMNENGNTQNIPNDTSYHGGAAIAVYISVDPGAADTTGLTWGWWGSGYDFQVPVYPADSTTEANTGYQQLVLENLQLGNSAFNFEAADPEIGAHVAWNASNNEVELAMPKSLILHPKYIPGLKTPDSIAVMIFSGENEGPWRADYACNAAVTGYTLKLHNKTTGVISDAAAKVPSEYVLVQNYPNPFNPSTKISYAIAKEGFVKLNVYNVIGQQVASLVNTYQTAGSYTVSFDAQNLPSGGYFYTLESGNFKQVRKMFLIK